MKTIVVSAAALLLLAGCKSIPEPDPVGPAEIVEVAVDPGWAMRIINTSIQVELPEPFIKLVDLARLRVGMSKEEVLAIFPNPFEIELQRDDELWQYGFAQLIFRGNRLRDWFNLK